MGLSLGTFRLEGDPDGDQLPFAAESRHATVVLPGRGTVDAKHVVNAACVRLPEGVSDLLLPGGAALTDGVQLIPSDVHWVRITGGPPTKQSNGLRVGRLTLTRLPGQVVWQRDRTTKMAVKTLRNEGAVSLSITTLQTSCTKKGALAVRHQEVRPQPPRAIDEEIFVQTLPVMSDALLSCAKKAQKGRDQAAAAAKSSQKRKVRVPSPPADEAAAACSQLPAFQTPRS